LGRKKGGKFPIKNTGGRSFKKKNKKKERGETEATKKKTESAIERLWQQHEKTKRNGWSLPANWEKK